MPEWAISTQALEKVYGGRPAVRELNLEVPSGSICGFLGRNGAGKTTTIKMLMGMARPTAGAVTVLGHDAATREGGVGIRRRTGFVSEDKALIPGLTARQMIALTRALYPSWRTDLEQDYVRRFRLPLDRSVERLSKGMRTRLALLLALARAPELLLLDEPTDGLDPEGIEQALQSIVAAAAEAGTTVFFSSHRLAEVEQIADRVAILEDGKLVVNDSLDELRASYRRVHIVFDDHAPEQLRALAGADMPGARSVSVLAKSNVDEIVLEARRHNARAIDITPVTLKDVFLESVGR
ncbi:MAG: ABC transporter ATP-binding protein [Acidobacteria bacterium]|nr:ABC transporter ATP-binding protein [Acidobacteriota bacterium]MBI3279498.1 ABC transporter ATP-binding protein [Acidobacteriota bacterium]